MRRFTIYKTRRFFREFGEMLTDWDLWIGFAVWIGIGLTIGKLVGTVLAWIL